MSIDLSACSAQKQKYESQYFDIFDTILQISAYTDSKKDFDEYSKYIYDELKDYHKLYDIYQDYDGINNIKTINDNAGKEPVKVDKKIIDLLLFAKQQYEKTDGAVNIAFGSVLRLWHDYREEGIQNSENAMLPPLEDLIAAAKHTDIDNIIIDKENSTVFLSDYDMLIDVGAVAKGYAVEQVCRKAEEKGFENVLVSLGGNVRAIGNKGIQNKPWNVGIQNPDLDSEDSILKVIELDNSSLVTSGDYQRYYIVNGEMYHHIINIDSLMPADYFSSITIMCNDSGLADAFSTAIFNIPFEDGLEMVNSIDEMEAMWVLKDGEIKYSNNFEKHIKG